MGDKTDALLRMYEGQIRHVRHHENLRSQATNMVVAVSAAVLAFLSTDAAKPRQEGLAMLLVVINLYGFVMSMKHYERSRLHATVAERYRRMISDAWRSDEDSIEGARELAHATHEGRFKVIRRIPAYALWAGLHGLIAALGLYLWLV